MNEVEVANQLRVSFNEAVLLQINEDGGHVSRERLVEIAGGDEAASQVEQELAGLQLAQRNSLGADVKLTPFGQRVADRIRDSMLSGARRADAVQRAILTWLNEQEVQPTELSDFLGTEDAVVSGVPVTHGEVNEAGQLLQDRRFIQTVPVEELEVGLNPRITPDGRAALHADVMISDYGRSNPTAISYDYSSKVIFGDHAIAGGVISGGQSNTQHIQQIIGEDVRSDLAAQLASLIKVAEELPDDTPGVVEVRQALATLSDEVKKPEADRGVLKELALKTFTAAASAAGTSGGQIIIEGVANLVKMLGG